MKKIAALTTACLILFGTSQSLPADNNQQSLQTGTYQENEPLILGAGVSTADSLRPGEIQFSPLGWVMTGVTGNITIMWDWLLALGPHPAGFIRYSFHGMEKLPVSMAIEVHGVWFSHEQDDKRIDEFAVRHRGWQGYGHMIATVDITENLRMHLTGGATYDRYQQYMPYKEKQFEPVTYKKYYHPDAAVMLETEIYSWLTINISYAYGNTLEFWDGIPHKQIAAMGILIKPFPKEWCGILSAMRVELSGFYVNVPDTDYTLLFPPLFPVVYWQWQF